MGNYRILIRPVMYELHIFKLEVGVENVWDLKKAIDLVLKAIEVCCCYKGFIYSPEESFPCIEPNVDEEYPIASGCFIRFISHEDALRFIKNIDPNG
ncbi:MAG: hypothetical protein J5881_04990 [Clostridia bacterium]|nr:hypothetical protein [Clostridia bacterium]